jgi:hypothetical protein
VNVCRFATVFMGIGRLLEEDVHDRG